MNPLRKQYSCTKEVPTNMAGTTHYGTSNYLNYDSGAHMAATNNMTTTTAATTIITTNSNETITTTINKNIINCQQQQQQQQQQHYQQQQQRLSMPVIFGNTDNSTYWSNTSTYATTKPVHARNKSASLLNQGNRHSIDRKSAASTIKFLAESKPTYCNATTSSQQQQQQHNSTNNSVAYSLSGALLTNSIVNGIGHGSSGVASTTGAGVVDSVGVVGSNNMMLPTLKCNRLPQAPTTALNESAVQTSVRRLSSDLTRKFDYRPIKVNTNTLNNSLNINNTNSNNFCAKEHQPLKNGNNLIAASFASSSYGQNENYTEDTLVLTENYRPISPPAEYASVSTKKILPTVPTLPVPPSPKTRAAIGSRLANKPPKRANVRYNYQRSRSHCHEMPTDDTNQGTYGSSTQQSSYNINSHKSLPDLHSQICRHSPHSEVFSCCSRGNKSIKSMGAESSLNRDSGSSGHYTHRSEPCYRMYESGLNSNSNNNQQSVSGNHKNMAYNNGSDYRRDSGSSTQHTPLSYGGGYITTSPMSSPYHDYLRSAIDCTQCLAKQQQYHLQQQQQTHLYAPCSPAEGNNKSELMADYRGNYATLEVPTAFQDDYKPLLSPPAYSKNYKPTTSNNNGHQSPCHQYATTGCYTIHKQQQQQQQQQQFHQQQQQQYYQQNQRYQQQQQMNAYRQHQHKQQQQQHLQQLQQHQQQQQQQLMKYMSLQHSPTSVQLPSTNTNTTTTTTTADDISPPAIQFKRQKCIRFKNRQQRFVLGEHACGIEPLLLPPPTPPPSANNTELCGLEHQQQHSQHHQQQQQQQQQQYFNFPKCYSSNDGTRRLSQGYIETNQAISRYSSGGSVEISSPPRQCWPPLPVRDYEPLQAEFVTVSSDNVMELERFFDRLGLNDESFFEIYVRNKKRNESGSDSDHSSTVYFSDVSTVDSMRLPDSSETQITTTQAYRPTEPLSIVERNARIIKWLCNIRKAQNV